MLIMIVSLAFLILFSLGLTLFTVGILDRVKPNIPPVSVELSTARIFGGSLLLGIAIALITS
jgi:hypothetical protein